MAHTPPRLATFSRALTSIAAAGVLVAGGLTYTAVEKPPPAAAEPCIPGSSPTCPPGPGPGPTTDVPTGPATTAPQAPTTTPPGAQQPTESPSDPTPNQGGNGMNVQTPNQPTTTNPNGIFGPTPTPSAAPTVQPTQPGTQGEQSEPTPTASQADPTATQQTERANETKQCRVLNSRFSAVRNGQLPIGAVDPSLQGSLTSAASAWRAAGAAPTVQGGSGGMSIAAVNDPMGNWAGRYIPPSPGSNARIEVNTASVVAASPEGVDTILTHELGHAYGVPDISTPNTLMNNGASSKITVSDSQALSNSVNGTPVKDAVAACEGTPLHMYDSCGIGSCTVYLTRRETAEMDNGDVTNLKDYCGLWSGLPGIGIIASVQCSRSISNNADGSEFRNAAKEAKRVNGCVALRFPAAPAAVTDIISGRSQDSVRPTDTDRLSRIGAASGGYISSVFVETRDKYCHDSNDSPVGFVPVDQYVPPACRENPDALDGNGNRLCK